MTRRRNQPPPPDTSGSRNQEKMSIHTLLDRRLPVVSGDEDGPAADPARDQVGERVGGGVQRVGPGVQGDPAALRQGHQLGEVVVGAHDVPDDVALGGDDVQRGDLHGAAVADDEVGAAAAGHGPPVGLGALLGHEVEDHVRPAAAGQVPDRPPLPRAAPACPPSATTVWWAPIWLASFSASGLRSTTTIVVAVSAARHWTPMWPRPPAPITTAVVPGYNRPMDLRTA